MGRPSLPFTVYISQYVEYVHTYQTTQKSVKVPVFYCLMKNCNDTNFYKKIFSLILTNLDQTHRDLLKITKKNFCKNLCHYNFFIKQ